MKRTVALLLTLIMSLSLLAGGCSILKNGEAALSELSKGTPSNASTASDDQLIVAQVGDEVVTYDEYAEKFNMYVAYSQSYGYDILSDPNKLAATEDSIIDILVEEKVLAYQTAQAGVDVLDAAHAVEVEQNVNNEIETFHDLYLEEAQARVAEDATLDLEETIKTVVAENSAIYTGQLMSYDAFIQWITDYYTDVSLQDMFREQYLADEINVTISDEDIQAWYETALVSTQANYDEDGGLYKDDQEYVEMYGGEPVVYVPEGYSRVLHILIAPQGEMPAEYTEKLNAMENLKTEYGELAFNAKLSGADNAARMDAVLKEYVQLQKEALAIEDAHYADANARAQEAHDKLEAGEDFASVMAEYTEDDYMLSYDTLAKKGLLISNKYVSGLDWSDAVKLAFAALRPGEYSNIIMDVDGCHILYYLSDETAGKVSLEDIRSEITPVLLAEAQDAAWSEAVDEWKNADNVVINEELVRSIGEVK